MAFVHNCDGCIRINTGACNTCLRMNEIYSTGRFAKKYYEYVVNDIAITKEVYDSIMPSTDYSKMFNKYEATLMPKIKKVIFNPPATIVLWEDNTKTVVRAQIEGFDPEKGLAMAISKKYLGNKGKYYNTFEKYISEWEKEDDN